MNFYRLFLAGMLLAASGCLRSTGKLGIPDWDTAVETDTDTDSDTDSDTDADTDSDSDSDTDTDTTDPDADGDGYPASIDCDDGDEFVNPGATEVCDGVDNNCVDDIDEPGAVDGTIYYVDADGDGQGNQYLSERYCDDPGAGFSLNFDDCDDTDPLVYTGMIEVCDNFTDDDCDMLIDEELDDDQDGYTNCDLDCDDTRNDVYPGAPELCDGVDNNCNGVGDEEIYTTWYEDLDSDTYGNDNVTQDDCAQPSGYVARGGDCDESNGTINPDATEVCDAADVDEDCNGSADNDDPGADPATKTLFYEDGDGDQYGRDDVTHLYCDLVVGYATVGGDCDDSLGTVNPDATEVCTTAYDDNCDSNVEDGIDAQTWCYDGDSDGFGDCTTSLTQCNQPTDYVDDDTDCDDGNSLINPDADEICDAADVDENCNNLADDADPTVSDQPSWCIDSDGDGYGQCVTPVIQCDAPANSVANGNDCNDGDEFINPDADEVCGDTVDEDCSGSYDDRDSDLDGHVDENCTIDGITPGDDCNDDRDFICPTCPEQQWTIWDDDCNGQAHNDGTVYVGDTLSVTFTGPNMIVDPAADSDFEAGTLQDWSVYYSDEGLTTLTVSASTWSGGFLPAGDYARLDVMVVPLAQRNGIAEECQAIGPFNVTAGQQYGFTFVLQNDSQTNTNFMWIFTQIGYDLNKLTQQLDFGTILAASEIAVVSGFQASADGQEFIVLCTGNWIDTGGLTHFWFGEASF